jgi:thioredoxin-related protein
MYTLLLSISLFFNTVLPWGTNFEAAQNEAKLNNKLILVNFSGSDWCAPCKRMKSDIFDSETFNAYAAAHLQLVSVDFPRNKKYKLSKEQVEHNEMLAERYNPNGTFPFTILLDNEGNILKTWEGMPKGNAGDFVEALQHN